MNSGPVERVLERMNAAILIESLARSVSDQTLDEHTAASLERIQKEAQAIRQSCSVRIDGLMQAINKANVTIGVPEG